MFFEIGLYSIWQHSKSATLFSLSQSRQQKLGCCTKFSRVILMHHSAWNTASQWAAHGINVSFTAKLDVPILFQGRENYIEEP